ncbi:integrase core domain-containing protein, partial [Micrococcus luteus]|uniref:integrase core domain-containing protein n=1 Tax=Micrococcus luteus TaxID=1270 RepID=UPI0037044640
MPPPSPSPNPYLHSFNTPIPHHSLNINTFYSLLHPHLIIPHSNHHYNHHPPHSSLPYLTPPHYPPHSTHQIQTHHSHNLPTQSTPPLSQPQHLLLPALLPH